MITLSADLNHFEPMGKIPRLNREIIVTEKIDGTNAQIAIWDSGSTHLPPPPEFPYVAILEDQRIFIAAGSRNRWVTPGNDNYGFAGWVQQHADELVTLGPGRHYGEWWGVGINRGYGLTERRFSLFNTSRWNMDIWVDNQKLKAERHNPAPYVPFKPSPNCCRVVPVLYRGAFSYIAIKQCLDDLRADGSEAAPGFLRPEGIVVYHTAADQLFKVTLENDDQPKSKV